MREPLEAVEVRQRIPDFESMAEIILERQFQTLSISKMRP